MASPRCYRGPVLTAEGSLGAFVTLTVPPPYAFPRKSGLRARSHRIAPHVTSYMGSATSVVDNFGRSPRPGRLRTCPRERRHIPSSDPSVQSQYQSEGMDGEDSSGNGDEMEAKYVAGAIRAKQRKRRARMREQECYKSVVDRRRAVERKRREGPYFQALNPREQRLPALMDEQRHAGDGMEAEVTDGGEEVVDWDRDDSGTQQNDQESLRSQQYGMETRPRRPDKEGGLASGRKS